MCRVARLVCRLVVVFVFLWCGIVFAFGEAELLPVDQAFPVSARIDATDSERLVVEWDIPDGYYLYQKKFNFEPSAPQLSFGSPEFPESQILEDPSFGAVKTHRGLTQVGLTIHDQRLNASTIELDVGFQGCSDIGICYPPSQQHLVIQKSQNPANYRGAGDVIGDSAASANPSTALANVLAGLGINTTDSEQQLLTDDEAFQLIPEVTDENTIHLQWRIADGYYLYRQKFAVESLSNDLVSIDKYPIPAGIPKQDAEFGDVQVFYGDVGFDVSVLRHDAAATELELSIAYQGCAEIGVCYPPINKTVVLQLPPSEQVVTKQALGFASKATISPTKPRAQSEQDQIASALSNDSLWLTAMLFLGFGLLLAFTPCCFPMIPILVGIIVGHGEKLNTWHAFWLSLSYVLGSAVTYTAFGVLAGLFGSNLQALFQNPWLLGAFSALFVVLALAMFGFYSLQLPSAMQSRLNQLSGKQKHGSVVGAVIMGMLSALIVGPCVAAPLAGALIYIGQTGDAVVGGFALFMMAIGMGLPLLVVGTSAGKLLPKAGAWMSRINRFFGFVMLGVSIWLLERIVPGPVSLFIWGLLAISSAIYMGALDETTSHSSGMKRLGKSVGIVFLVWGILLELGAASGARNPLAPLERLIGKAGVETQSELVFQSVNSVTELNTQIVKATQQGRWVMLDYYADWCVSCKEMEYYTFTDMAVQQALSGFVLLKADVTEMTDGHQALLSEFQLVGPPATLFFGPDQLERKEYRLQGYKAAADFLTHIQSVLQG